MSSRRVLLRHLWAMVQTRAEAAVLVVQLQRTAVTQGLLFSGIAAATALSFMTAVIVWIAVAAPPAWRGWALGIVSLALLATAIYSAVTAGRKIRRDARLIADFSRGLKLDLAMINLALKDPETDDEEKLAERERAKTKVREAAVEKAATPSTAEDARTAHAQGVSADAAAAAMRAASPGPGTPGTPGARTSTPAPQATGPATTRPAGTTGYAFTAGGTYAATSASDDLAEAVTEREVPTAALRPEEAEPGVRAIDETGDTERKRSHGSP